jgi:predicted protein tyrosine phosphatase
LRNILFICSKNQWRSPTGEKIFKNHAELNVRSAGTSASARKTVNFIKLVKYKDIQVLDIPDEYQYMDEELVDILEQFVSAYLGFSNINLI